MFRHEKYVDILHRVELGLASARKYHASREPLAARIDLEPLSFRRLLKPLAALPLA